MQLLKTFCLAAGIRRVKGVKKHGVRIGNWLTAEQGQRLLAAFDTGCLRGKRDYAMVAVLLGCGLRRAEAAALSNAFKNYLANLEKYAQELGLDMTKFKADLDSGKFKAAVEAETKEGSTLGVTGTPAVFINGRKISGAYPFDTFKKIADEELAKKTGKKRG